MLVLAVVLVVLVEPDVCWGLLVLTVGCELAVGVFYLDDVECCSLI